ncbi:transposase [Parachlamydia sp. AcF125]|uniref:transposase n=1 Tax=Parachlamydia sp. AcF125 TaxID=2795736 RepID=UPI001BC99727
MLVDTKGLLLQAKVTAEYASDKQGLIEILQEKKYPSVRKTWGDSDYSRSDLKTIASQHGAELEVIKRPPERICVYNEQWQAEYLPIEREFTILPRRWVVEKTFAWMGRNRRLSHAYECLPCLSESYLYICMSRLMFSRWNKKLCLKTRS